MPIRKLTTSPQTPQDKWERSLNGYFIAFARRVFHWSPAYREAVLRAEQKEGKEKRYRCESCGALVERSQKQVDHIDPVVPIGTKWDGDWNGYRNRLFVTSDRLRVLCKPCHAKKTGAENQRRRQCQTKSRKKKIV